MLTILKPNKLQNIHTLVEITQNDTGLLFDVPQRASASLLAIAKDMIEKAG